MIISSGNDYTALNVINEITNDPGAYGLYFEMYMFNHLPVPLQSVLVVTVEEVRLGSHCPDVRMNTEKLQQSPGSSFLHPDDDRLRQLLAPGAVREAGHGAGPQRSFVLLGPHPVAHLVPVVGSVRLRLVIEQVSGRGEPDGGLFVVALDILPRLRLGQQFGH